MCYLDTANRAKHTIGVYEKTVFDIEICWRIRMSSQESFDELEPKIMGLVEKAIREVKEEYLRRLQDTRNVIDELLGEAAEAVEAGAIAEADIATMVAPEPVEPPKRYLPDLHDAVTNLDRCRTQNEILSSLVESAGTFASRAALFLTREDGLQGWSSHGFAEGDEAFEDLGLEYDEGSPWGRLSEGRGVIELDADECAELCSRIDNSSPLGGVMVPIVLRDHLAAALYADQADSDDSVGLFALQLLAYVAAQALETLPLRERSSTATLRLASEAPYGEPVLSLWQFSAPEADVEIVEEIVETAEPALEEEAEDLYAAEPVEEVAEEAEVVDLEEAEEVEGVEQAEEPPVEPVEVVEFEEVEEEPDEEAVAEEEAEVAEVVDFEEVEEVEEPPAEPVEVVEFEEVEEEPDEEAVAEEEAEVAEAVDFEEAEEVYEVEQAEEPQAEAVEAIDFEEVEEEAVEEAYEEAIAEDVAEAEEDMEIAAETDLQPAEDTGFEVEPAVDQSWAEPAEVEAEPVAETVSEDLAAPPQEPEVAPAPVAIDGAEINPPEDAQGPGWAFTTNRFSADAGSGEAVHEEARRLARLLVTEIKLYNEEQVEAGRRNRNIYEVLREDIDRSRQIYEERIDDTVRTEADYFHDELVRILAAGESEILGL